MKKQLINDFFLGIFICFTMCILVLALVMSIVTDASVIPVRLVLQSLLLSILSSLINLVYRLDKLTFAIQSIVGYILTTSIIMLCGLIFNWYGIGSNGINITSFVIGSFVLYSVFYLITWIIIWSIRKARTKDLNQRLNEYKKKH